MEDVKNLSSADLRKLLRDKEAQERDVYEALRADLVLSIEAKVLAVVEEVCALHKFIVDETTSFKEVMKEYGKLTRMGQKSFRIQEGDFRVEVISNKVKKFDERADIAADRLLEFLQAWIERADGGVDNPMYQLAMLLLERNKNGDLDYKSVSKLYDLEAKFMDDEYSEIMQLFKESNVIEGTAINYYFYKRDERGVWRKVEPSFNRL